MPELILTSYTYDQGRIVINNMFSGTGIFNNLLSTGTTQLGTVNATTFSSTTFSAGTIYLGNTDLSGRTSLWSASTGFNSIIASNSYSNLASGNFAFVLGTGSTANGNFAIAIGDGATASTNNSLAIGIGATASGSGGGSIAIGNGSLAFGVGNNFAAIGGQAGGTSAVAFGGGIANGNDSFAGSSSTAVGNKSFAYSESSTANAINSAILGGSANTISAAATNAVVLGMNSFNATSADTVYSTNSYIDGYIDLNAQTVYPAAKPGRVWFSGGTLNRLILYTGATVADYMIL